MLASIFPVVFSRYLWMSNTDYLLDNVVETDTFISGCKQVGIQNVFLSFNPQGYAASKAKLQTLLSKLHANNINPWAADGHRDYFSDVNGPNLLLQGVDNMLGYNDQVSANEKFYGFQTDIEVVMGSKDTFHHSIADSKLDANGGGIWKGSQLEDRRALLADWLNTHSIIKGKLAPKGLKLGAAIPWWTNDYAGEPLLATFAGTTENLFTQTLKVVDEIHIMSYQTDPTSLISRSEDKFQILNSNSTIKGCASIETLGDSGGPEVSYADSTKNNLGVILSDVVLIETALKKYSAFNGICIHNWDGLRKFIK